MTVLANLSIRGKFVAAFAATLALVAILGLYAIVTLGTLRGNFSDLEASLTSVQPLQQMGADAQSLVQLCAETHIMADPDQIKSLPDPAAIHQQVLAQEAAVEQDFAAAWNAYSPTMEPGRETNDGQAMDNAFNAIVQAAAQETAADQGSDNSIGAKIQLVTIQQQLAALQAAFQDDVAYQKSENEALDEASKSAAGFAILCCVVLLGVIILATILVGVSMIRSISAPITGLTGVMNRLAARDFSPTIPGLGRKDEIGSMAKAVQVFKDNGQQRQKLEAEAAEFQKNLDRQLQETKAAFETAAAEQKSVVEGLAAALAALARGDLTVRFNRAVTAAYETLKTDFNKALEGLQDTMRAIAANIHGVKTGASEINRAADDLSKRTEQQAAALEQTAAALDEITATVKRAADGAKQARDLAANAKSDAERSGEVVRDMVGAMNGIETSSKQIGNIIGVIDEIAFQTNLLALNAGVEAARAGDAGRGFAVVATEVRALAQRSAEAAKEIKALISASGEQVEGGVKLVGETGKTLSRIADQVAQLNAVVVDIAASAQEQATGLTEVNTAVNQMDQVTQRNAAMVQETTAASGALAGEAEQLAHLIARFQVGAAATPTPTPPAAPPRRAAPPPAPAAKPAPAGRAAITDLAASSKRAASGGGVAESSQDWSEF